MTFKMNDEQLYWISMNLDLFLNAGKSDQMKRDYVYYLYNLITGENKKPNGCGACWRNVKKRVYMEYEKHTNIY